MTRLTPQGFTLVELMIATTVFSIVLLLCATILVDIGRAFQKGVTGTQTQDSARTVLQDVSDQIMYGSAKPITGGPITSHGLSNIKSYCIGNTRYTYVVDGQVTDGIAATPYNSTTHKVPHALWRDTIQNPATCPPVDLTAAGDISLSAGGVAGSGKELVPLNSRLRSLDIISVPTTANLWKVNVGLAYGDEDLFVRNPAVTGPIISCVRNAISAGYCGFSDLSTEVYRYL